LKFITFLAVRLRLITKNNQLPKLQQ